jgi:hypothetical protein
MVSAMNIAAARLGIQPGRKLRPAILIPPMVPFGLEYTRRSPFPPARMKIVVILIFIAILASLGSALFFVVHDRGQSKRTVKALAIRVGLSLGLFLLLMAGYYFGLIPGKIT